MLKVSLRFLIYTILPHRDVANYFQNPPQKKKQQKKTHPGLLLSKVTSTFGVIYSVTKNVLTKFKGVFQHLTFHFFPVIFPPLNFHVSPENSKVMHFLVLICKSSQFNHVMQPIVESTAPDIRNNQSECISLVASIQVTVNNSLSCQSQVHIKGRKLNPEEMTLEIDLPWDEIKNSVQRV